MHDKKKKKEKNTDGEEQSKIVRRNENVHVYSVPFPWSHYFI